MYVKIRRKPVIKCSKSEFNERPIEWWWSSCTIWRICVKKWCWKSMHRVVTIFLFESRALSGRLARHLFLLRVLGWYDTAAVRFAENDGADNDFWITICRIFYVILSGSGFIRRKLIKYESLISHRAIFTFCRGKRQWTTGIVSHCCSAGAVVILDHLQME